MGLKYRRHLDRRLKPLVEWILQHFEPEEGWTEVKVAAGLHLYVGEKVDYEKRGSSPRRPFRDPVETLQTGGNCQEKSVLLASLYASVKDLSCRIADVERSDEGHAFPELQFNKKEEEVVEELKQFYTGCRHFPYTESVFESSGFAWEEGEWFVADVMSASNYVGDLTGLSNSGYVKGDPLPVDGLNWVWKFPEKAEYHKI